jgi:dihydropyrimidinase
MATFDLIIRGGTVATGSDVMTSDVGVKAGHNAALGLELGAAAREVDARGKLVLPGGIDSHVHIAQPSGPDIVQSDDFESGTRSAVFGGNTTVIQFCLQERGQGLRRAIKDNHAKADGQFYRLRLPPDHLGPRANSSGSGTTGGNR